MAATGAKAATGATAATGARGSHGRNNNNEQTADTGAKAATGASLEEREIDGYLWARAYTINCCWCKGKRPNACYFEEGKLR